MSPLFKRIVFLTYHWSITLGWALVLFILIPSQFSNDSVSQSNILYVITKAFAFGVLFLLVFRSLLTMMRLRVKRLAVWRTLKEHTEDIEFVSIVESLLILIGILLTFLYAYFIEFTIFPLLHPNEIFTQTPSIFLLARMKAFLADTLGILIIALVSSFVPILHELEYFLIQKAKR